MNPVKKTFTFLIRSDIEKTQLVFTKKRKEKKNLLRENILQYG